MVLDYKIDTVTTESNTNEQVLYSKVIQAETLNNSGKVLKVKVWGRFASPGLDPAIYYGKHLMIKFDGNLIGNCFSTKGESFEIETCFIVSNNLQKSLSSWFGTFDNGPKNLSGTFNIDLSQDKSLELVGQVMSPVGNDINVDGWIVEVESP